jgi:MFS superfamily sulfate permease-like transporter
MSLLIAGFLIDFISLPVIAGFTSAAAITIATGQVKSLLGITVANGEDNFLSHVASLFN